MVALLQLYQLLSLWGVVIQPVQRSNTIYHLWNGILMMALCLHQQDQMTMQVSPDSHFKHTHTQTPGKIRDKVMPQIAKDW